MNENLKIALVANTSWSLYNFRLEVAKHLQSLGAEIFVIAPRDKHSEKLIAEGFRFISAPVQAYSNNPIDDIRYFLFLKRIYKREQFTHVFHYTIKSNIYGSLAARVNQLSSTALVTGLGRVLNMKDGLKKTFIERLYSYGLRGADRIWFLNKQDKNLFEKKKIGSSSKYDILPSEGVKTEKYKRKSTYNPERLEFLFAARLLLEKGIGEYLSAATLVKKYYPEVVFTVAGFLDPKDQNCIDQHTLQSYQRDGTINFLGDIDNIKPVLEKATCVILPSYYGEGVSKILMEAAAMEIPVITSKNRGCSDVVVDGYNGFLCEIKNVNDLTDQIMAFISLDEEAKTKMGQNGRKLVQEKYEMKVICDYYSSYLQLGSKAQTSSKKRKIYK